jgi:selenocysteine-specific elongation factor
VPLLRRRTPVRAYIGSAEIMATLVFETVPALAGEVKATLFLRKPALAFPGVRFVARRASPKTLLGGGAIEGAAISGVDAADGHSASESAVATALASAGLYASEPADIAYTVNLREDVVRAALEALADRDEALRVERPRAYVSAEASGALLARITSELETFVRSEPWALGITSLALARRLEFPEPLLVRFLTAFVDDGRLAGRAGYYAPLSHEPALRDEQRALFASLLAPDAEAPLRPVPYESVVTSVKRSEVDGALKALDTLIALGTLVKVADELYRGSQIAQIRARVETLLARQGRMTAAEFRDAIGTSRKYAMPLLEWLDAQGVTIRDGDYRMLRKRG